MKTALLIIFRILLGLVTVICLLTLTAWVSLPYWLPKVAKYYAPDEIEKLDFYVESYSLEHLEIAHLDLKHPTIELELPKAYIRFSGLMEGAFHLNSLIIEEAEITLNIARSVKAQDEAEAEVDTSETEEPDSFFEWTPSELVIDHIVLKKSELTLRLGDEQRLEAEADGFLANVGDSRSLSLKLSTDIDILELQLSWDLATNNAQYLAWLRTDPGSKLPELIEDLIPKSPETYPQLDGVTLSASWKKETDIVEYQSVIDSAEIPTIGNLSGVDLKGSADSKFKNLDHTIQADLLIIDKYEFYALNSNHQLDTESNIIIQEFDFRFEGASFQIVKPTTIDFEEPDFDLSIQFWELDSAKLLALFPEVKEEVIGVFEGALNLNIQEDQLNWGDGYIQLKENTTGEIRYGEEAIFNQYIPDIPLIDGRDRLMLDEALRNIILTRFYLDINPSDQPDMPSVLEIGGQSNSERFEVPIERITFNLRGDVHEAVNQWVDISSFFNRN